MPAPWYEKEFPDVTIPITPNYNLSSPDKAQHVRQNPGFTQLVRKKTPFCDSCTQQRSFCQHRLGTTNTEGKL
jgi:hypothetical protein